MFWGLCVLVYLLVLKDDICWDAFVNHFGEDGRSWGAVPPAGLLCQPHLVALGAQWSLQVNDTHDTQHVVCQSFKLIAAASTLA